MKTRSLSKYMRNFKIRTRILLILLIFTIIPSLFIYNIERYHSYIVAEKQLEQHIITGQTSIEKNIKLLLNQVDIFSLRVLMDKEYYEVAGNGRLTKEEKQNEINKITSKLAINEEIIGGLVLTLTNGERYSYSASGSALPLISDDEIKKVENQPYYCEIQDKNVAYTVQTRRFVDFYTGCDIGFLSMYIKKTAIYNVYKSTILYDGISMIVDQDMNIVSCPDFSDIGDTLYVVTSDNGENMHANYMEKIQLGNKNMVYSCRPVLISKNSSNLNWYIISYVSCLPLENTMSRLNTYILLLQVLMCLFAVIFSVYISKVVIVRIKRLRDNMEHFGEGTLNISFCNEESSDEIWFLERSFDEMSVQIDKLIEKNNYTKEMQRESEMKALQAQINPHFIYNTLDSIGWLAKIKNQPEIEQLVCSLGSFFRISLHKGDKYICVREEIEHVKSYIEIEQIRVPNKFNILFDISDEIIDKKIIKIILQPLVENAIKYGAIPKKGIGNIRITGFLIEDEIHFEITDDGMGFDTSILSDPEIMGGKPGGYGIKNVNDRIKLEYGKDCGIHYTSEIGKFTRAEIVMKVL